MREARPLRSVLPELEVVDERSVPELDGRIDPRRLLAKRVEARAVERRAVDEHVSSGGPVPPEQQADERRLAGTGRSDDRDVLAWLNGDRRVLEDRVTTGPDGDGRRSMRRPRAAQSPPVRKDRWPVRPSALLERSQRLEQPQRQVALGRVCQAICAISCPSSGMLSAQ